MTATAPKLPRDTNAARKTVATAGLTTSLPVAAVAAGHIVKVCSLCGAELRAAEWQALPKIGEQDDGTLVIELRNHRCGTTLARPVRVSPSIHKWEPGEIENAIDDMRAELDRLVDAKKWNQAADLEDEIALLGAEVAT